MSRLFPTAPNAEDQPLSRTILTVHCLTRGATTGAGIGGAMHLARDMYRRATLPDPTSPAVPKPGRPQQLLRATGTGTAVGIALLAAAVLGRMRGREDVEWADRSWRLMGHPGQLECDDFTYGGAVLGVAAAAAAGGVLRGAGWRGLLGAAGGGSVVGTVGYLVWRYGVNGGVFEEVVR